MSGCLTGSPCTDDDHVESVHDLIIGVSDGMGPASTRAANPRTQGTIAMAVQTSHHYRSSGGIQSPVDDQLYDLLQALTSKCEAIEAYAKYEEDASGEAKQLFQELARDDTKHAERLLETLRSRLNS